jgi:hypothetical protein
VITDDDDSAAQGAWRVILQLWLLTATMNAYLGGDESVIGPAAAASAFCLILNLGLLRYLYVIDRTRS